MNIDEYLSSIAREMPRHLSPSGAYYGRAGALKMAREIGYGLRRFPDGEVERRIQSTYSAMLVRATFNTTWGVPIDASEWFHSMRVGAGLETP